MQQQGTPEDMIEQLLLNLLLNPVRLRRQRIRMQNIPDSDILYEIKEAVIINEQGVLEEHEELVINTDTFDDASPKNIFGLVKCSQCGSTVREGSVVICQYCARICCAVQGCGIYSRSRNKWYCCRWHAFLGFLGIGLRI
ncbi:hypothetical protein KKG29_05315 [Patescibacteria group bacterium]|nr:hypothetical protein [Patescibacteria group bacterium]